MRRRGSGSGMPATLRASAAPVGNACNESAPRLRTGAGAPGRLRPGRSFGAKSLHTVHTRNRPSLSVAVMLACVATFALEGVSSKEVTVEVDVRRGLQSFTLVGLPDRAVRESRERVRAAVLNSGLDFPQKRITVN